MNYSNEASKQLVPPQLKGYTQSSRTVVPVYMYYRHHTLHIVKIKVKVTLEQATKAQRGSRSIALLFI
jgi:hypothetical protein